MSLVLVDIFTFLLRSTNVSVFDFLWLALFFYSLHVLVALCSMCVPFGVAAVAGVVLSCFVDVVGGLVLSFSWLLLSQSSAFVSVTRSVVPSPRRLAWLFSSGVVCFVCAVIPFTASVVGSIPILSGLSLLSVPIKSDLLIFLVGMWSI